jgi:hypothetical protein
MELSRERVILCVGVLAIFTLATVIIVVLQTPITYTAS